MDIDWKHIATTPGYKSLKAAYMHDVRRAGQDKRPMRKKDEFLKHFRWVIGRAIHYAYVKDMTVDQILDEWEAARPYSWLHYYQAGRQPKLHSNSIKRKGLRGLRKYYKKCYRSNPVTAHKLFFKQIVRESKRLSTKKPRRWTNDRKRRGY